MIKTLYMYYKHKSTHTHSLTYTKHLISGALKRQNVTFHISKFSQHINEE